MRVAASRFIFCIAVVLGLAVFGAGDAYAQQDRVWVQLEAHPDLQTADRRVRAYARVLPDVNGYRLRTGWYAIALGPYSETDGAAVLAQLRAQGAIPQDAYLSDREIYQQQFFPIGATTLEQGGDTTAPTITQPVTPVAPARETVAEARQSERLLSREEREALQIALQWFGHYNSGIDGAFGPGTRAGMTSWQEAQGLEPTGILTTGQRARLMADYQAALDALGMQRVRDERAGIEIDLPLAMVEFTRYEYPFAQYEAVGGSGIQVLLISQEGTAATLGGLYEIMQTLEIVPLEGERTRRQNSFVLTGQNDRLRSHTVARLEDGQIKGFTLVWTPERDSQMARVLDMMESSFQTFGGTLDPGAVDPGLDQGVDLMAGLDVRQPDRARSGFYIDGSGRVLTTAEAVQSCTRVMVDGRYEMAVSFSDPGLNVAVLQPTQALAPSTVAGFPTVPVRIRADVAVAGFPYDGVLDAASLNFGTVADMQGLDGDERIARLDVSLEPSEAGAPVLDATGAVVGMALPAPQTGRALPDGVSFALRGDQLAGILDQAGVTARRAPVDPQPMSRNALARYGANLAVLVTCWN